MRGVRMVSQTLLQNRIDFMESYKLLDVSGTDTENEIIQFAALKQIPQVSAHPQTRKKRLKRRERDLLRSGHLRYENSSKCITWDCCCFSEAPKFICCEPNLGRSSSWNKCEYVRSFMLVVIIICLSVVTGLALNLHTRLDAMQSIVDTVEASGSELPAKFHESHVRLQQLEKNHTSLWTALSSVTSDVDSLSKKMKSLESSLKSLEDRLSGTPQLSSLPKDVADIQASVATFGSSLQDVQSSLKSLKDGHDSLTNRVDSAKDTISSVKREMEDLRNETYLPSGGREESGDGRGKSLVSTVILLQDEVAHLSSSLTSVNSSVTLSLNDRQSGFIRVQSLENLLNDSLRNLTQKVESLESVCGVLEKEKLPSQVSNISAEVSALKEIFKHERDDMGNLNQSIAVVKGVERKLEGSQLQMASGVSELKQQLQKVEKDMASLMPTETTPSTKNEVDEGKRRKARYINQDFLVRPVAKLLP